MSSSCRPSETLKRGDELLVDVSCKDAYLRLCCVAIARDGQTFHLDNVNKEPPKTLNPNPEAELCNALAGLQTTLEKPSPTFTLESSEIALLNNKTYHNSFQKAMSKLLASLKMTKSQESDVKPSSDPVYVLDVSEGFSVLSLIAAKLGVGLDEDKHISTGFVQAYSSVEKEHHQTMLRLLAKHNGVPESTLEFWLRHVEDDSAVFQRPAIEKLWSAIVLDCIETCGLIREKLMEKASLARYDR